jgi:uncharacterized protein involved in exopolysaccharide biosynthesis
MSNTTSTPSGDVSKPAVSVGDKPVTASALHPRKRLVFLRKFWWIPLVTLTLSVSTAVCIIFNEPPVFVSYGKLWETQKLRLPVGADYSEDRDNFLATQDSLLRSDLLRKMTLTRMQALGTNPIPKDFNGNPPWVDIQTITSPHNSVYTVAATGVNPDFTQAYLDALMQQFLEYRKNIRAEVSGVTLASIAEQVQRLERDMQEGQADVDEFERSNNFAVLQLQGKLAVDRIVNLNSQLANLQLEDLSLNHPGLSETESTQHQTIQLKLDFIQNSITDYEARLSAASELIAKADSLKQKVLRNKPMFDQLSLLMDNLKIGRDIDQENVAILEPASPATRSKAAAYSMLEMSAFLGFAIGVGIIFLLEYRAHRRHLSGATPDPVRT